MTSARAWQAFRLEEPALPELPRDGHGAVAIVGFPSARDEGWAPRAAAALAQAWARAGRRTYLCDLAFEEPRLHDIFEVDNDEGLSDALLYGVSPRRIAHAAGEGLFVAPAGTVAAHPAALRASPRWDALVDAFDDAGALLLLYVPSDADGVEAVVARADAVVALAAESETVSLAEGEERLVAVLGPAAEAPAAAPVSEPEPGPEPSDVAEPASTAGIAAAAAGAEAVHGAAVDGAEGLDEPVSAPPVRGPAPPRGPVVAPAARGGRRGGMVALVVLAVVALGVVAWALGWLDRDGSPGPAEPASQPPSTAGSPAPAPAEPVPTPADSASETPSAEPVFDPANLAPVVAPVQTWAVALEAHRNAEAAWGRVDELGGQRSDLLFWVVPVASDGVVYHRVLAGPALDVAAARALRDELVPEGERGHWNLKQAPLAFVLAEAAALPDARARARELAARGVPTYVLAVEREDGTRTYRVYAGAFGAETEAGTLRRLLGEAGVEPGDLVERRGEVPR